MARTRPPLPGSPPPLPPPPGQVSSRGLKGAPAVEWSWVEAVLLYLVGSFLIGGLLAAAVLPLGGDEDSLTVLASLVADLAFGSALVLWMRRRHPGWRDQVVIRPSRRDVVAGIGLGALLYPAIALLVGGLFAWLFDVITGQPVEQPEQLSPDIPGVYKVVAVVLVVLVAPVVEELFFRGLLYRSLRDRYGVWVGMLGTSVLFGLVHWVPAPWVDALFLQTVMVFTGLGLAAIYEWRGNLLASICAHATFNAIGVTLIFTLGYP